MISRSFAHVRECDLQRGLCVSSPSYLMTLPFLFRQLHVFRSNIGVDHPHRKHDHPNTACQKKTTVTFARDRANVPCGNSTTTEEMEHLSIQVAQGHGASVTPALTKISSKMELLSESPCHRWSSSEIPTCEFDRPSATQIGSFP